MSFAELFCGPQTPIACSYDQVTAAATSDTKIVDLTSHDRCVQPAGRDPPVSSTADSAQASDDSQVPQTYTACALSNLSSLERHQSDNIFNHLGIDILECRQNLKTPDLSAGHAYRWSLFHRNVGSKWACHLCRSDWWDCETPTKTMLCRCCQFGLGVFAYDEIA